MEVPRAAPVRAPEAALSSLESPPLLAAIETPIAATPRPAPITAVAPASIPDTPSPSPGPIPNPPPGGPAVGWEGEKMDNSDDPPPVATDAPVPVIPVPATL